MQNWSINYLLLFPSSWCPTPIGLSKPQTKPKPWSLPLSIPPCHSSRKEVVFSGITTQPIATSACAESIRICEVLSVLPCVVTIYNLSLCLADFTPSLKRNQATLRYQPVSLFNDSNSALKNFTMFSDSLTVPCSIHSF